MIFSNFYIELGRLLYAVAKVDGQVHPEEQREVLDLIKHELTNLEESVDEFGTDNAFYAEFEFERLLDIRSGAKYPYLSFVNFAKEHPTQFTKEIQKKIIYAVERVAFANGEVGETERVLISKLKHSLEEI